MKKSFIEMYIETIAPSPEKDQGQTARDISKFWELP